MAVWSSGGNGGRRAECSQHGDIMVRVVCLRRLHYQPSYFTAELYRRLTLTMTSSEGVYVGSGGDETKLGANKKPVTVNGVKYQMRYGSRRQVKNGTAYITKGRLKQNDLTYNNKGRIVSLKKSIYAKKDQRLLRHGFTANKGKFGAVRIKPMTSSAVVRHLNAPQRSRRAAGTLNRATRRSNGYGRQLPRSRSRSRSTRSKRKR